MMVGALRTGDLDDVAGALAVLKGHEVEEVEDPRLRSVRTRKMTISSTSPTAAGTTAPTRSG
jgi:hypothetical protein